MKSSHNDIDLKSSYNDIDLKLSYNDIDLKIIKVESYHPDEYYIE